MADRYDKLNHNALMASVGSMSRRWNEDIYVAPPQSIDDFFAAEGPSGIVIADELAAAIRQVAILSDAIRATSYIEPEPLPDLVLEAIANQLDGPRPSNAATGLAELTEINEEIYQRLTALRMSDWSREAMWGSEVISLSDLTRGVSRVNAERLSRATRTLQAMV